MSSEQDFHIAESQKQYREGLAEIKEEYERQQKLGKTGKTAKSDEKCHNNEV